MVEESTILKSSFRGLSDEEDEEKNEEIPLDENPGEDGAAPGIENPDDEEEELQ